MRPVPRLAKIVVLSAVALLAAALVAVLGVRAYRQHVTAQAIVIHAPNGIDEEMYVRIGGIDQWIQIRGQDRANPALLCLHGGPGATWSPLIPLFVPWEKKFTVVQWDQRGAGKTLGTTGPSVAQTMSVERMTQDGIEVAEFLRKHLHQEKIVLLGHSWGSILGINMARRRPDLFYAYVGTGQVSSMPASLQLGYARLLEKARAANDAGAIGELEAMGRPPFDDTRKVAAYFERLGASAVAADRVATSSLVGELIFAAPNYSLWDVYNRLRGFTQIPPWQLYQEMLSTDLPALGHDFKLPVYFFQGAEDDVTPAELAKAYLEKIEAPRKEMVLLEGVGHFAVWSVPERFLQELVVRVRPLAVQP